MASVCPFCMTCYRGRPAGLDAGCVAAGNGTVGSDVDCGWSATVDGWPVRSLRSGHPILSAFAYGIGCVKNMCGCGKVGVDDKEIKDLRLNIS